MHTMRLEPLESLESDIDYSLLLHTLCALGMQFTGTTQIVPGNTLSKEAKQWYHFLISRLMPFEHYSDVSKERLKLLYALMTKTKINLWAMIHTEILSKVRNVRYGLYFPSLIT